MLSVAGIGPAPFVLTAFPAASCCRGQGGICEPAETARPTRSLTLCPGGGRVDGPFSTADRAREGVPVGKPSGLGQGPLRPRSALCPRALAAAVLKSKGGLARLAQVARVGDPQQLGLRTSSRRNVSHRRATYN